MLYFPMLYSQALHKKCTNFSTLSVIHMHHLTKGHSGITKVSTPKNNVKVFSEVDKINDVRSSTILVQ